MYRRNHIGYRILDAFFRTWRLFVVTTLVVLAVVSVSLFTRENQFTAQAWIRAISERESDLAGVANYSSADWRSPAGKNSNQFGDMMHDLLPGGFVDKVLKDANLKKPISIDPDAHDARFAKFQSAVFATAQSQDVFTIGIVWDDSLETERLVQSLQHIYIQEAASRTTMGAMNVSNYLDSEIEQLKRRVEAAEAVVTDYKKKHMGEMPDNLEPQYEKLQNMEEERVSLIVSSQDSASRRSALQQALSKISPTVIIKQTTSNDTPNGEDIKLLERTIRDWKREGDLPNSSRIREAQAQIDQLKKEDKLALQKNPQGVVGQETQDNPMYFAYKYEIARLEGEERARSARLAMVNQQIQILNTTIAQMPEAEKQITDRLRDFNILTANLKALMEKREATKQQRNITEREISGRLQPMREISAETTMNGKRKIMIVGTAIALGLFIGALMVVLREWADPSLRYEPDTERILGVPVLISLPEIGGPRALPSTTFKVTPGDRPTPPM